MHDLSDISNGTNSNGYFVVTGICLFVAEWIRTLDGYHVPEVIMQLFQIFAWTAAGVSCLIGLYFNLKKRKNKFHEPN